MSAYGDHDLPDRVDPVMAKELRQNLRRSSFVAPFLGLHALAALALAAELLHAAGGTGAVWGIPPGPLWLLIGVVCVLILPMGGLVMMTDELDEGNHELLQLARVRRWRMVLGKFLTLWGLSIVAIVSMLPYVVVRYLVGGVEWWREASLLLMTLCGAAIVGAGAIGASAFRSLGARTGAFLLFLVSAVGGCGIPLSVAAIISGGAGIFFHFTSLVAAASYSVIGLSIARSRIRLAFLTYELKPAGAVIGIVIFAPFFIGFVTALSLGFGGWLGLGLAALVAVAVDKTPRGPAPAVGY